MNWSCPGHRGSGSIMPITNVRLWTQDSAESHGRRGGEDTGRLCTASETALLAFLLSSLFPLLLCPSSCARVSLLLLLTWLSLLWGELHVRSQAWPFVCPYRAGSMRNGVQPRQCFQVPDPGRQAGLGFWNHLTSSSVS